MHQILDWLSAGSPPHYVYILVAALLLVEYLLPRATKPEARSILEIVANLLRLVPGVGPLAARFGSPVAPPQPPPSPPEK